LDRIDTKNLKNQDFAIQGEMRDAIGMSMSNDKLVKINLNSLDMKGVICSTNRIDGMIKPEALSLDCLSKVRANPFF